MADAPVDEFLRLLSRLTPSAGSNELCVRFVHDHAPHTELLFRCMLKEMTRVSLNARAKYVNFLEYAAGMLGNVSAAPSWPLYIARDLVRIIDAAIPSHLTPASLANVRITRSFIRNLKDSGVVDTVTCERADVQLQSKEANLKQLQQLSGRTSHRVTKDEVLRRIEDDRERSKKLKERQLAVDIALPTEFDFLWAALGPLSDLDLSEASLFNELADLPIS